MEAFLKEGFLEDGTITPEHFEFLKTTVAPNSGFGDQFWDKMLVEYRRAREKKKIDPYIRYAVGSFSTEELKNIKEEKRKLCRGNVIQSLGFDPCNPSHKDDVMQFAIDVHNEWDKNEGAHHQLSLVGALEMEHGFFYNFLIHCISLKVQDSDSNEEIYKAKVSTDIKTGKRQLMQFHRASDPPSRGIDYVDMIRQRKRKLINPEARKKNESEALYEPKLRRN